HIVAAALTGWTVVEGSEAGSQAGKVPPVLDQVSSEPVDVVFGVQVPTYGADVVNLRNGRRGHGALHSEEPIFHVGGAHVAIGHSDVGLATDQAAAGQQAGLNARRQGIGIWWIRGRAQSEERLVAAALQAGGSQRKFGTVGEVVVIKLFRRFVVEDPETTADRHLAWIGGVPAKPEGQAETI